VAKAWKSAASSIAISFWPRSFQLRVRQGNSIPLMLRCQAQAERPRCPVEEFERVRKLRPQLPNEPISADDEAAEPEENTTFPRAFAKRTHFFPTSSPR
jgi:hypothetical protein